MGGGDGLGEAVDQEVGQAGRRSDAVEFRLGREAAHFQQPFDWWALAVQGEAGGVGGDRNDAQVKLWSVLAVELELVAQGLLAPPQGGEVEEAVADRALELEGAVGGQEDDGGVGVDAFGDRTEAAAFQEGQHIRLVQGRHRFTPWLAPAAAPL